MKFGQWGDRPAKEDGSFSFGPVNVVNSTAHTAPSAIISGGRDAAAEGLGFEGAGSGGWGSGGVVRTGQVGGLPEKMAGGAGRRAGSHRQRGGGEEV